jgi:hypothetical protein
MEASYVAGEQIAAQLKLAIGSGAVLLSVRIPRSSRKTRMNDTILSLLIFFTGLGIGGGLYETPVVYPRWKNNPAPATLTQKLESSGQNAALRFWPLISPMAALLSVINMIVAWRNVGFTTLWFGAALLIFLKSLATYFYFVPTMMRKFKRAETMDAEKLKRSVSLWTSLSPIRIIVEVVAWVAALSALLSLR